MVKNYVAPNATVVGDVILEENANIWYGAVLRGDAGTIHIGEGSNVQDNAVLHDHVVMGKHCTVGHGAIVHGCTIGDECLIGMGAIVLNGAELADGCIVGAGAVVAGKMKAPENSLLLGSPAKIVKTVTEEQRHHTLENALHYIELAEKAFC